MNIWGRIKQLSISQICRLSYLFVTNPLLIPPTLKATKKTINICDAHFGHAHHKSNPANAFRHALWNYILCQKMMKILKNDEKSIEWVQKLTKMYEKVTNNTILDETMDLHNNEVGRNLFLAQKELKEADLIEYLLKMIKKAIKIENIDAIENCSTQLVYISE